MIVNEPMHFSGVRHGRLCPMVPSVVYVLPVRGGEEHHRVGQRNPEDSPGTEKERTKGNQSSPVR